MEFPSPSPKRPPGPMAYSDWIIWKPLPSGSLQGFRNDIILWVLYGAIIISTTTPMRPSIPILTKKFRFTPLTNSSTTIVITITTPVPKSGSNIIRANTSRRTPSIGRTPFLILFRSLSLFSKYFAVKIIRLSLVNSDGCIPKPPNPNQLLDPFLTVPIPGINTSTKREVVTRKIMLDSFL